VFITIKIHIHILYYTNAAYATNPFIEENSIIPLDIDNIVDT